jgi:hypothetical protein
MANGSQYKLVRSGPQVLQEPPDQLAQQVLLELKDRQVQQEQRVPLLPLQALLVLPAQLVPLEAKELQAPPVLKVQQAPRVPKVFKETKERPAPLAQPVPQDLREQQVLPVLKAQQVLKEHQSTLLGVSLTMPPSTKFSIQQLTMHTLLTLTETYGFGMGPTG